MSSIDRPRWRHKPPADLIAEAIKKTEQAKLDLLRSVRPASEVIAERWRAMEREEEEEAPSSSPPPLTSAQSPKLSLAEQLRAICERKHWSRDKLAEELDLSVSTLQRIDRERDYAPSKNTLLKIRQRLEKRNIQIDL
jgi:hypothetical protein